MNSLFHSRKSPNVPIYGGLWKTTASEQKMYSNENPLEKNRQISILDYLRTPEIRSISNSDTRYALTQSTYAVPCSSVTGLAALAFRHCHDALDPVPTW
jgi:hypothetical protein